MLDWRRMIGAEVVVVDAAGTVFEGTLMSVATTSVWVADGNTDHFVKSGEVRSLVAAPSPGVDA